MEVQWEALFDLIQPLNALISSIMNPADRLRRLFVYDQWACHKILITLEEHEQFELRDEAIAIFTHIVVSQRHWYNRISGMYSPDLELWPAGDLVECQTQLASLKEDWAALINENEERLDRFIGYQNSKGITFNHRLSDILHHVIIHGQHHRAQIAFMLRGSGIVPPPSDFIFYLRETEA